MTLYITLASCAFLAGWLVYRYDMYEREPWYMVLFAVALGMGAMYVIGYVEEFTLRLVGGSPSYAVEAMIPATHEEGIRLLVVAGLALFLPSQFNDPMDGIIYGSLVGLGMAIDESLFYLSRMGATEALPRTEIVRILGHVVMGGINGFGLGMFRVRMKGWCPALLGCFGVAVGLHFCWDYIAFKTNAMGESPPPYTIATITVMMGGMLFFGFLVMMASEWSRRMFAPEQEHRLWGWPFTLLIRRRSEPTGPRNE